MLQAEFGLVQQEKPSHGVDMGGRQNGCRSISGWLTWEHRLEQNGPTDISLCKRAGILFRHSLSENITLKKSFIACRQA